MDTSGARPHASEVDPGSDAAHGDLAGHDHAGHRHGGAGHVDLRSLDRARRARVLAIALGLNGILLVVQVIGGLAFGSLALLADSAHLATDVLGLGVALVAERLLARPATKRHSYGLQRAEVLGALANGILLLAATVWITVEAIRRLGDVGHIDGPGVAALGLLGLIVNLVSALAIGRVAGGSMNLRGAWLHLMADAAGSVLALIAGVAIWVWDARAADPIVSLLLAALVVVLAVRLVRDATHVLLEGVPAGVDPAEVAAALRAQPSVLDVHHVHVWALASDAHALSAHIVLDGEPSLHEAQERGHALRAVVAERFGIDHTTLELECHACDEPDDEPGPPVSRGVSRSAH